MYFSLYRVKYSNKIVNYMKKLIILLLFLVAVVGASLYGVMVSPYLIYEKLLKNTWDNEWYRLENTNSYIYKPTKEVDLVEYREFNDQLYWFNFHILDVKLPLPVRHPLYLVAPVPHFVSKDKPSEVGIKFYAPNRRELLRIYFLQNIIFTSALDRQPMFKLPLVKQHLLKIPVDKIWSDLFTKPIGEIHISVGEMIYNLYLLQLRESILPKNTIDYGLIDGEKIGIIELESLNKDYLTEYILTRERGVIYSYLIISEKNNPESIKLRSRFLKDINFESSSSHLTKIIYQEFKGLPYSEQIGHEGLLYLFSAWTHDMNDKNFIKEMIVHLERGVGNELQLVPLYRYAFDRFGETFSERDYPNLNDSDEMKLRRSIDREKLQAKLDALIPPPKPVIPEKKLTPKEEMEKKLREAKKKKDLPKDRTKIILDN
jgi:hypothetical protein